MPHETVRTETTPDGKTVIVRRRRSSHHRHRRHRHHGGDGEAVQRRRQDLRFLAFALPLGLLAIGFLLWMFTVPRPGSDAVSDEDLLSLSWWMMGVGGALLAVALIVEWIRRGVESVRNGDDETVSFSDGDGD
ncbi:MAG: hypothetical protein II839_08505 [Kiritimatiellae bacterium]|nr:hypothetical protein [Kiritimatiellia bacterium]